MSNDDLRNLNFLLTIGKEGLDDWIKQADADDATYAAELLEEFQRQREHSLNILLARLA